MAGPPRKEEAGEKDEDGMAELAAAVPRRTWCAEAPNLSLTCAAQPEAEKREDGEEGDEDEDADEEDPVAEVIKSLPGPVQRCVGALQTLALGVRPCRVPGLGL